MVQVQDITGTEATLDLPRTRPEKYKDPRARQAPHAPTFRCLVCGTRLRTGQPHSALEPVPHQVHDTLIVRERVPDDPYSVLRVLDLMDPAGHVDGQKPRRWRPAIGYGA